MRPTLLPVALLLIAVLFALAPKAEGAGLRNAAATENDLASRAAVGVMAAGGNAVDGAIAAALMGGVVSPTSSGIGGGGFALVWLAKEKSVYVLDFRERAPAKLDVKAFEARPFSDAERGKYVGVPGEVAGLHALHGKFGKRAWKDVVAPAIQSAKQGFPVGRFLAGSLAAYGDRLRVDATLARIFYPQGKPAAAGARVVRAKLAATLERIAAEGPQALYAGEVARDIVDSAKKAGGSLELSDLANYRPVERTPLRVRWGQHEIVTMPPPSAGGLMVVQTLSLLEKARLAKLGKGSGALIHLQAEAMRGAIADRMRYLGDPDHVAVDVAKLTAPARMAKRRAHIGIERTHTLPRFGLEEHGTHHMVTADAAGNVVSLTTTVNRTFGAKLIAPASGIVLNDELDDFTAAKDVEPFGMKVSPNRPRPGARPVSSMTPTFVLRDGKVELALGGSGGTTIATNVTQVLVSWLTFGGDLPKELAAPRFQVPSGGPTLLLEKGVAQSLREDLAFRGEILGTVRFTQSAVQGIALRNGQWLPASDPRKFGAPAQR